MTKKKNDIFSRFTTYVSTLLGRPWMFALALGATVIWAVSGPIFGFSDTWQLIINTGTTVATFLIVFIIQNTQNRDNMAMNIKLDALMEKHGITKRDLLEAEDESDKSLEKQKKIIQHQGRNNS